MPRVNRVKSCRKAQGTCGKCGKDLPAGSAYIWVKARYGPKRRRCTANACRFRPSELTGSEIKGTLYSQQEYWEDLPDSDRTGDVAVTLVEDCRIVVDEIEDKLSNIEDGFGHSDVPVYYELEERKEEIEAWLDEGENFAEELRQSDEDMEQAEDVDEPDEKEILEEDYEDEEGNLDEDAYEEAVEQAKADYEDACAAAEDEAADNRADAESNREEAIEAFDSWLSECPE